LGAVRLGHLCQEIENLVRAGKVLDAPSMLPELEHEYELVRQLLTEQIEPVEADYSRSAAGDSKLFLEREADLQHHLPVLDLAAGDAAARLDDLKQWMLRSVFEARPSALWTASSIDVGDEPASSTSL